MSKIHKESNSEISSEKQNTLLMRYQNRNRNTVLNMRCITEDWINYKKRFNPYLRTNNINDCKIVNMRPDRFIV